MSSDRVDYDRIAATYDNRFADSPDEPAVRALSQLLERCRASRVLEVGCGTGHWLAYLVGHARVYGQARVYGVDLSYEMLRRAQAKGATRLTVARANSLPFARGSFDLVYVFNAIHHFHDPAAFVGHAVELLTDRGALAILGIDPPQMRERWYLYDYFPGTYETDLRRYPRFEDLAELMRACGLRDIEAAEVLTIVNNRAGRDIFSDPFLSKDANSQLALLSDDEYAAGVERMERAIQDAEAQGRTVMFRAEFPSVLLRGFRS